MPARHVVVDGSNIATEGSSLPTLKQLDEAVREFLTENPDDIVTVVVDATFGHRIPVEERKRFEQAELEADVVSPPAGAIGRGDAFLLRVADKVGAVVLSNDSFQEFHGEYEWLFDKGRLIGGKPVPGVGWIFTPRSPVRGPKSRESVKEAKRKRRPDRPEEPDESGLDMAAERTRSRGGERKLQRAIAVAVEEAVEPAKEGNKRRRRRRGGEQPSEPLNEPFSFISFIAAKQLGDEVEGTVEEFSSHGAFISVDGARCYLPLSAMGDVPPRSAREVLRKGETRTFVVQAFDAMRRGIELAMPGFAHPAGTPTAETIEAEIHREEVVGEVSQPTPVPARPRSSRRAAPDLAPGGPIGDEAAPARRRVTSRKAITPPETATPPESNAPGKTVTPVPRKTTTTAPRKAAATLGERTSPGAVGKKTAAVRKTTAGQELVAAKLPDVVKMAPVRIKAAPAAKVAPTKPALIKTTRVATAKELPAKTAPAPIRQAVNTAPTDGRATKTAKKAVAVPASPGASKSSARRVPASQVPAIAVAEETLARRAPAKQEPAAEVVTETPARRALAGQAPASQVPAIAVAAETPARRAPARRAPAGQAPAIAVAEETPARRAPAKEVPVKRTDVPVKKAAPRRRTAPAVQTTSVPAEETASVQGGTTTVQDGGSKPRAVPSPSAENAAGAKGPPPVKAPPAIKRSPGTQKAPA
jgi:hypothetical protein